MKKNYLAEFIKYVTLNVMGMVGLSCYILADTFFISMAEGADEETLAALRAEGNALDAISLEAFKEIQVQYLKADDCDVYMGHPQVNTNIELLQGTLAALDKGVLWGDDGDGALDIAFNMNSYHDWYYYYFGCYNHILEL